MPVRFVVCARSNSAYLKHCTGVLKCCNVAFHGGLMKDVERQVIENVVVYVQKGAQAGLCL